MRHKLPSESVAKIAAAMSQLTGKIPSAIHVNTPRVCDHCQNANEEAFPYHVYDARGRFWRDLCNGCFDELGCAYEVAE